MLTVELKKFNGNVKRAFITAVQVNFFSSIAKSTDSPSKFPVWI